MKRYELPRTKQEAFRFEGEEIAKVYGEWWNGIIWTRYHNLAVYRTVQGQYVLAIHFRTGYATVNAREQPHDYVVQVQEDENALARELAHYDPFTHLLDPPYGALDDNYLRARYWEEADALLALVRRVEKGECPPLRKPVIVEYGEIDDDVRESLAGHGAQEGISPAEVLRRSILEEMEAQGEEGVTVDVIGAEDADDES